MHTAVSFITIIDSKLHKIREREKGIKVDYVNFCVFHLFSFFLPYSLFSSLVLYYYDN